MVEKTERSEDATPRATTERRWEVFVREETDDPMQRVGTIAAPDAEVAYEEASKLFAWYARDVWVCPADEVRRFSEYSLAEDAEGESADGSAAEPRVYEETEGTPNVRDSS